MTLIKTFIEKDKKRGKKIQQTKIPTKKISPRREIRLSETKIKIVSSRIAGGEENGWLTIK